MRVQLFFHFHLSLPNNSVSGNFSTEFFALSKYMPLVTYPAHRDSLGFIILSIYVTYSNHNISLYVIPEIFKIIQNRHAVPWLAAHVRSIYPAFILLRSLTLLMTLQLRLERLSNLQVRTASPSNPESTKWALSARFPAPTSALSFCLSLSLLCFAVIFTLPRKVPRDMAPGCLSYPWCFL